MFCGLRFLILHGSASATVLAVIYEAVICAAVELLCVIQRGVSVILPGLTVT